jgi:excisionase family DNA binding protein
LNLSIMWSIVMSMARVDEHYLRVRDYAERFNLDESTVYKKIDRGEIRAIRIGRTVRIPSSEMDRYLQPTELLREDGIPEDDRPVKLAERVAGFERASGRSARDYVAAWRSGKIKDTPENAQLAIEALALRAALEQPHPARTK